MTKRKWFIIVGIIGFAITIGGTIYALIYQRYLEAVAVSCIVPALTWFATGAGKAEK